MSDDISNAFKVGSRVRVYPQGSPDQSIEARIECINGYVMGIILTGKQPFPSGFQRAGLQTTFHGPAMLVCWQSRAEDPNGPWMETHSGERYEIDPAAEPRKDPESKTGSSHEDERKNVLMGLVGEDDGVLRLIGGLIGIAVGGLTGLAWGWAAAVDRFGVLGFALGWIPGLCLGLILGLTLGVCLGLMLRFWPLTLAAAGLLWWAW